MSLDPFDAEAFNAALVASAAAAAAAAEAARIAAIEATYAANIQFFTDLDAAIMAAAASGTRVVNIPIVGPEIHTAIAERYKATGCWVHVRRAVDGTITHHVGLPDAPPPA